MTQDDLRSAEELVLRQFRGEPLEISELLAKFERQTIPAEVLRRAVWSLVEKGKLEITSDLSLRKPVAA